MTSTISLLPPLQRPAAPVPHPFHLLCVRLAGKVTPTVKLSVCSLDVLSQLIHALGHVFSSHYNNMNETTSHDDPITRYCDMLQMSMQTVEGQLASTAIDSCKDLLQATDGPTQSTDKSPHSPAPNTLDVSRVVAVYSGAYGKPAGKLIKKQFQYLRLAHVEDPRGEFDFPYICHQPCPFPPPFDCCWPSCGADDPDCSSLSLTCSALLLRTLVCMMDEVIHLSLYRCADQQPDDTPPGLLRPGHIIAAIQQDPELMQFMKRHNIMQTVMNEPLSLDDVYWPKPRTAQLMALCNQRYSWYHQFDSMSTLLSSDIYNQHVKAYLQGQAGDDKYFRQLHIRPVQYLGRSTDYATQTEIGSKESPWIGHRTRISVDDDTAADINAETKATTQHSNQEGVFGFADFDIVDAKGVCWSFRVEYSSNPRITFAGRVYDRATGHRVAEINLDYDHYDDDDDGDDDADVDVDADADADDAEEEEGESELVFKLTYHGDRNTHPNSHAQHSDPPLVYAPWRHLQNMDQAVIQPLYGPIRKWGHQSNTPESDAGVLELEQLLSIACWSFTQFRAYTQHPALYTANHPTTMHIRVYIQAKLLQQQIAHTQTQTTTITTSSTTVTPTHTPPSSISPASHIQHSSCSCSGCRLSNVWTLMLLIGEYAPATDLPYIPGVSDAIPIDDGGSDMDKDKDSLYARLTRFIEPNIHFCDWCNYRGYDDPDDY